jgi:hypothetical protein
VAESASNAVDRFTSPTTLTGSNVPAATLSGPNTQLNSPTYLTVDGANDVLYVASTAANAVLMFNNPDTASGNVTPARILVGTNTQLNGPVKVQLDSTNNLLYVANANNASVAVFNNATTTTGNVTPIRTLAGSGTQIVAVSSIFLDVANDRLWVSDPSANSLLVFAASTANGAIAPTRVVSGSNTQLAAPTDLLQSGSQMFVSCTGAILRFQGTSTIAGNVTPAGSINGTATTLQTPAQLGYNGLTDELFVADSTANKVDVFTTASSASGAVAPGRSITMVAGFSAPKGLALDLTR